MEARIGLEGFVIIDTFLIVCKDLRVGRYTLLFLNQEFEVVDCIVG